MVICASSYEREKSLVRSHSPRQWKLCRRNAVRRAETGRKHLPRMSAEFFRPLIFFPKMADKWLPVALSYVISKNTSRSVD